MSSSNTIIMYQMATKNLGTIGGSIAVIFGSIGAMLCLCVFGQKAMRQNVGSIYFIAFNVSNTLLLWISLVPSIHHRMMNLLPTTLNLIYCRFALYALNVLTILPSSCLILAAIDRSLVTSRNALTRQRSTRRLAFSSITGIILLWLVYYLHIWFFSHIQSPAPGIVFCFFDEGVYSQFMSYSGIIVNGFLPPCLMTIFAIMTIKNFRRLRVHPTSHAHAVHTLSSKDRQLTIMLLYDVAISVVFLSAGSILYIYAQGALNRSKTMEEQALNTFLMNLSGYLVYMQAVMSGYSNFIVSKAFRKNLKKRFWSITSKVCRGILMNNRLNEPLNTLNRSVKAMTMQVRPALTHE